MHKTLLINAVGLSPSLISKENTPTLHAFAQSNRVATIGAVLPAVTTTVQSTYLTGLWPSDHGIVGNGWYFRETAEVRFWLQSNKLVAGEKVWEKARKRDPNFTCANMFWWYNMYSSVDYSVTPRPMYPADGRKLPDIYTHPASLRTDLQSKLGQFPLFNFWGPATSIKATSWIADATIEVDRRFNPTLTLVYLPHMDYALQKRAMKEDKGTRGQGDKEKETRSEEREARSEKELSTFNFQLSTPPSALSTQHSALPPAIAQDLRHLDSQLKKLLDHFQSARIILLSEYGITPVSRPIHINRILRQNNLIAVREELARELLDPGASAAFAVADHQVAHVYVNDPSRLPEIKRLLESTPGIAQVLDEDGKKQHHLDHPRAGDLVCLAEPDAWFTYYYWLDDARAPDFARTVDIHRKPGYDPVELFIDPKLAAPKLKIAWTLLKKKLGFRTLMNVIPLDATLVKGSHGLAARSPDQGPLLISNAPSLIPTDHLAPTDICDLILRHIFD